jgi:uncharacterized cupredoxin-like copper-binding protein
MACGGSSKSSDVTIEVQADNTRFVPSTINVPAGKTVTLKLVNKDDTEHDLQVQGLKADMTSGGGHGGHGSDMMPGTVAVHANKKMTAWVTFMANERGTYEIWCTVSGHKEVGMVGQLVVA